MSFICNRVFESSSAYVKSMVNPRAMVYRCGLLLWQLRLDHPTSRFVPSPASATPRCWSSSSPVRRETTCWLSVEAQACALGCLLVDNNAAGSSLNERNQEGASIKWKRMLLRAQAIDKLPVTVSERSILRVDGNYDCLLSVALGVGKVMAAAQLAAT